MDPGKPIALSRYVSYKRTWNLGSAQMDFVVASRKGVTLLLATNASFSDHAQRIIRNAAARESVKFKIGRIEGTDLGQIIKAKDDAELAGLFKGIAARG